MLTSFGQLLYRLKRFSDESFLVGPPSCGLRAGKDSAGQSIEMLGSDHTTVVLLALREQRLCG
jgi:hypothetical protein